MTDINTTLMTVIAVALAVSTMIGVFGTCLESIGNAIGSPGLVSFGQKLESIGSDIPKLLGKDKPAGPALVLLFALSLSTTACASQTETCLAAADANKLNRAHVECKGYTWDECPARFEIIEQYDKEQEECRPESLR